MGFRFAWILALVAWAAPVQAQFGLPNTSTTTSERENEIDSYRSSPRYTVQKFLELTDHEEFEAASAFLSWPYAAKERVKLAKQLKTVIDRKGWINVSTLSSNSDGNPDDIAGNAEAEKVGELKMPGLVLPITLQKSTARDGPQWLFERSFLKKIPDLYKDVSDGWLGRLFPAWMSAHSLGPLWLWQWLGLLALVVLAYLASGLAAKTLLFTLHQSPFTTWRSLENHALGRILLPLRLLLLLFLFRAGRNLLELPLAVRTYLGYGETTLIVVSFVILGLRCADTVSMWLQNHLTRSQKLNAMPMVPALRKGLKILVSVFATLAILRQFGFDITGIIAGLGVGGIAIALAGQKTIENLFGGITLILDQPVRVGDFCRFGTNVGTIEDIGLRSTRIRTLERTLVSIPNAEFSHMQLENFAKRDKIRFYCKLGLRYETTPNQMRLVLVRLKELLLMHAMVENEPARARFVNFGTNELVIEVFAYVRTADFNEYLAVAEDLNLRIMDIIKDCGSDLAFPSQTLYLERSSGLNSDKIKEVESQVAALRANSELPLPFYPPAKAQAIIDSLPFNK